MIRCIAIDDEPLALELLEDNIRRIPYLELVATCGNPLEAVTIIREQNIDLVFLDIQMPGLNGLQLIQSVRERPMFILITAYEKYALEGFNLDVIDYLMKPVPFERFVKACNKAWELYQLNSVKREDKTNSPDHFFLNVDYSHMKVVFSDIEYIEGLKDYIKIHLKSSSKPVVTRMSLKTMEEQLPPSQFIRIHKSYIVSKQHIQFVKKNSVTAGKQELPVGESYKEALQQFINQYKQ